MLISFEAVLNAFFFSIILGLTLHGMANAASGGKMILLNVPCVPLMVSIHSYLAR